MTRTVTSMELSLMQTMYTKPLTTRMAMELHPGVRNTLTRMIAKGYIKRRGRPYAHTLTELGETLVRILT